MRTLWAQRWAQRSEQTFAAVVLTYSFIRYRSAAQARDEGAESVERLERMIEAQAKQIGEMDKARTLNP